MYLVLGLVRELQTVADWLVLAHTASVAKTHLTYIEYARILSSHRTAPRPSPRPKRRITPSHSIAQTAMSRMVPGAPVISREELNYLE